MALGAVSDLRSIVETANDIRTSINSWYKISGQIKLFDDQLRRLSDEHEIWGDKIKKFGRSNDQDLRQKIREAQATLNEEKQKLFGVKGRSRFISKIKLWLFPAKLESSIQKVTTFCDDLSRFNPTTREKEIEAVVRQGVLETVPSFSFTSDTRYFPLVEMEEKVKKELRGEHSIILLYGGSGTGKSALARNLALHFQQEAKERGRGQLSDSSQSSNSSGTLFERVLYLECGPEVSLEAKQKEVVHLLDPSSSTYDTTDADTNGKSLSTTSLLSSLLKERSLLIILDDVWKSEKKPEGVSSKEWPSFLKGMTRHGRNHVKWLITSQSKHLCDQMDMGESICRVGMEPIQSIVARRIFASLTRLKESDILGVQDVMDRIIDKIDANLLALTCVASNMSLERNTDKEEWKRLEGELIATLKSGNSMEVQGIHGPSYWAAIKFGWERLTPSQQYLLCLMQICSGPSVPSGVIEYFFQQTKQQSYESFSKARNELEGKQLLTVRRISTVIMSEVEESWSIHDLLKRFIGEVLVALVDSMISTFVQKRSTSELEFDVLINAAYLYFNEGCRKQLANKVVDLPKMSHLADLQKGIISPITKFLTWDDGEQCTSRLRFSSMQVILKYIKDRIFDEVHTSNLLVSSESQAAMLLALRSSAFSAHHPTIGQQIIRTLVTLLERQTADVAASSPKHNDVAGLLRWTSFIFAESLRQTENKSILIHFTNANFQTILDRLTSGLLRIDGMNKGCAAALANLACYCADEDRVKMIKVPGLLQNLVIAMERDDFPDCQAEAARALLNLSFSSATALQIVDFSGVLEALLAGLENPTNVQLQESSAWTVANLASLNDDVKSKIMAYKGLVSKLVSSMVEVDNHGVKFQCARALANLTLGGDEVEVKMIKVPGLLQNLVIAMERDDFPDCQAEAARALLNLSISSATALQIVDFSGVLEALLARMENPTNVQLQENSAWTVANLTMSNDDVRSKVMACEGVVSKLVSLMVEVDNHGVKFQCARALVNLTSGGDEVEVKMIKVPGLLQNLVIAMERDDFPDCQAQAARALSNLACSRATALQIVDFSGVLEALLARMENPTNVQLQENSAWTVANLTMSNDDVRSKVMACEGVVSKLVSLMVEVDNHGVKFQCARALVNLTSGGDEVEVKMIKVPGLLQNLVIAMERDDFPDCQAQAARALSNLACSRATALQIVDFSGVLEALLARMENPTNVQLQENSAWTVANLTMSNDDVRSKVMACEGVVSKLVSLMVEVDNHGVKFQCARALVNLTSGGDEVEVKMIKVPGLLQNLVIAMERDDFPDCQAQAARALSNLACSRATALQIVDFSGVLEALLARMENPTNVQLQENSAWTVANLTMSNDDVRSKVMACEGVVSKLVSLMVEVDNHDVDEQCARALANLALGGDAALKKMIAIFPQIVDVLADAMAKRDTPTSSGLLNGILALTLLSPTRAKEMELDSAVAYLGRARGELISGVYQECLEDCDRSMASLNETPTENPNALDAKSLICGWKCCAKAKLRKFQDALADADILVQMAKETELGLQFALQERGVVKLMMNDFRGALADLDASLSIDEKDDYEVLKHRGFVKFRLQDEEGARADAERALRCKPSGVDDSGYGRDFLGGSPVQYLNFELR